MRVEVMQKIESVLRDVLSISQDTIIAADSKLKDDLGLDSMSSLTFLMALEEKINGFIVDPDTLEMSDLDTVSTITSYVLKQSGYSTADLVGDEVDSEFSRVVYA